MWSDPALTVNKQKEHVVGRVTKEGHENPSRKRVPNCVKRTRRLLC